MFCTCIHTNGGKISTVTRKKECVCAYDLGQNEKCGYIFCHNLFDSELFFCCRFAPFESTKETRHRVQPFILAGMRFYFLHRHTQKPNCATIIKTNSAKSVKEVLKALKNKQKNTFFMHLSFLKKRKK